MAGQQKAAYVRPIKDLSLMSSRISEQVCVWSFSASLHRDFQKGKQQDCCSDGWDRCWFWKLGVRQTRHTCRMCFSSTLEKLFPWAISKCRAEVARCVFWSWFACGLDKSTKVTVATGNYPTQLPLCRRWRMPSCVQIRVWFPWKWFCLKIPKREMWSCRMVAKKKSAMWRLAVVIIVWWLHFGIHCRSRWKMPQRMASIALTGSCWFPNRQANSNCHQGLAPQSLKRSVMKRPRSGVVCLLISQVCHQFMGKL